MIIEIDDALVAKAIADLRGCGHLKVDDDEIRAFLKYNCEVVLRAGAITFYERWLKILGDAIAKRRKMT